MWELQPRVPVNIKRRSISAVRDFPKGCGPKVIPKPNPPVELESKPKEAEAEADGDAASVESSSFKVPRDPIPVDSEVLRAENGVKLESLEVTKGKEVPLAAMVEVEGLKINGHVEECVNGDVKEGELSSMRCVNGEEIVLAVEIDGVKINGHVEESLNGDVEVLDSKKCGNGDVKEEKPCKWKGFPVLKRRKVSAVRDFPVGCGRGASKIRNVANSEVGPVASSESKVFYGGKKVVDDEVRMNGGKAKGSAVGGSVEKAVDEVTNGVAIVKSPKVKTSDGDERKPAGVEVLPVKKLVAEVKKNESPIKSPKAKSSGEEKKPLAREKEVMEGSDSVSSAEMAEAGSNRTLVSADVNNSERISEEKKPVTKQGVAVDGSTRVSSAEVVETEAKKHVSSKVRVKSPLKGSSSKSTVKDHSLKMLAQYSSKKELEGNDVKQVSMRLQVKESRDAKPPSGFKIGDKEGGSFTMKDHSEKKMLAAQYSSKKELEGQVVKQVSKSLRVKDSRDAKPPSGFKIGDKGGSLEGKTVDKRCIDTPKDGKNLKRKFLEEERDESLEAFEDREIVHALVAAENCPWRSGRKSGGRIPRSTTPKVKAKRVKKLLGGNSASASRRALASPHESIMDEEDSQAQDGGNEMAIALYDGSRELCITMTPAAPPGQLSSSEEAISRNMVKKTLRMFQLICRKLVQGEEKSKGRLEANSKENNKNRVDLKAASMLKDSKQWVNHGEPIIGHVPGVEVGDEFHFRVELSIIGLHRPFQAGIDYCSPNNYSRKGLATSIVASGGYPDDTDSSDVLIYSGSGGNAGDGNKQAGDQKLERGNLALKNSMDSQSPVRVVYGSKELVKSDPRDPRPKKVATFTYDGLYIVEKYWPERGNNGFNVFKFQLRRMPGQPEIALKEVKKTRKSKVREGLCLKDISDGKERIPICAVNTVDGDQPIPFHYITRVRYPSWYVQKPPRGCDCTNGCSDSEKCACAVKNGGEIPFNYNGAIVQARPLVYECGPSCKCPPTCHNRVSQHGIRLPLEIFKTSKRGWGVRSLYSIPSGTFVCEYVGEMLDDADAEQRSNDEYLFDIGHNYDDRTLWEGLPSSIPGLQSDIVSEAASESMNDAGFTIDAAEYGNVGRFINHSCSPNLYAQNLLYDHDDKKMPHVMFFAIDNIPPLQELTYHYNYTIDQVRDSAGNIKKKECLCGSSECTGRLY